MYNRLISALGTRFGIDAHYFVGNSFWLMLTQGSALVSSFAVTILFAHYLSEEQFGVYRYLVVLASIFAIFGLNSIGQAILQTTAQGKTGFFYPAMRIGLYSNLGSFVLGASASAYYLYNDNLTLAAGCVLIALFQPFIANYFNIFSFLSGAQKYKTSSLFQTIRIITISGSSIITIGFTSSILILFAVYQISQLITAYIGYLYFKPYPDGPTPTPQETKKYYSFAVHQSIQAAVLGTASRLDSIILFQSIGASALSVYTIALVIPDQVRGFVKNFSTLLLPKYVQYTPTQLRRSIKDRSVLVFAGLMGLALSYIAIAPFVFPIVFPKYEEAIFFTQILALAIPASASMMIQSALKAEIDSTSLYVVQLTSAGARTVLTLAATWQFGIIGTVSAFVAAAYIEMILYYSWFYLKR